MSNSPIEFDVVGNNSVISPARYIFWLDDLTVLYKNKNYIRFIPTSEMSRVEQLNALTRFFIYLFILFILFGRTDEWLYVPIVGIIFIIVLYNLFEFDENGKRDELLRMKRKVKSPVTSEPELNYRTYTVEEDGETKVIDIDDEEQKKFEASLKNNSGTGAGSGIEGFNSLESLSGEDLQSLNLNRSGQTDYVLEAGYIDSNGDLQYGTNYEPTTQNPTEIKDKVKYSLDEFRIYEKNKCRAPTKDNPFMNPTLMDFNKTNVPVACNADDEDIHNDMEVKFDADMYRNLEDVYNRKNSQRQFFTVAHNIPNDLEAFGRWCYGMPATCKTDQTQCLRYQDLRAKY